MPFLPLAQCVQLRSTETAKSATCWTCREHGAELNGNWRGGRTRHKAGYVMVRLPEHPRARTHGYVFEHILAMEAFLDRHLMPDENVHHRNGLRADNRIENLELWVRPQPNPFRALDGVRWARMILARYEDLAPPQTTLAREA